MTRQPLGVIQNFDLKKFQLIANYLNIKIQDPNESLKDGVVLCQLVNEMKRNSVRKIMMPQVLYLCIY